MVFVLNKSKKPLDMITNAEARILIRKKLAVIHKVYPFTIRLRDNSAVSKDRSYAVKLDPGSKTTGVAITDDKDSVVMLAEIEHRGHVIKKKLDQRRAVRYSRRQRKTRYREARFLNRTRPKGWIAPSVKSRADNVINFIKKYKFLTDKILVISAQGRGLRQMCHMDKYGFPRTSAKASKSAKGFQTGDIVKAVVTKGLKVGEYLGRAAIRSNGSFCIKTKSGLVRDIGYKYCHLIQRGDGYSYNYKECDFLSAMNCRVPIAVL